MNIIAKSITIIAVWATVGVVAYYCKDYNFGWGFLATWFILEDF